MATRCWLMTVVAGIAFAVPASAQPPGGGGPEGMRTRGMGGMGMGGDPSQFAGMIFARMSKGKDVITREDVDDRGKPMYDFIIQKFNITNGQINREQFTEGFKAYTEQMRAGGMARGPGGAGGGELDQSQIDQRAEFRFRM